MAKNGNGNGSNGENTENGNGEASENRLELLDAEYQARVKSGKPPKAAEVTEALKTWKTANEAVKKAEAALRKAEEAASGTIEAIVRARGRTSFQLGDVKYQFVCRGDAIFLREFGAKPVPRLDDLMK